jgi:hypothetical protein
MKALCAPQSRASLPVSFSAPLPKTILVGEQYSNLRISVPLFEKIAG